MSCQVRSFEPLLSAELLWKHNFFELYPFDGGGSFVNRAIMGSTNDAEISRQILRSGALDEFGSPEEIDFCRYEFWQTIEKSCWINRLYFIVPLARTAALNGDKSTAELVRRIILRFYRLYPPPPDKMAVRKLNYDIEYSRDHEYNTSGPDFNGPAPYQWFDFQPASRILHILYAVWFLKDMDVFSDEDHLLLDRLIADHARVIAESYEIGDPALPGNHEALRALAMFMAGAVLYEHPQSAGWRSEGYRLCQEHIMGDFLPDGMCTDLSPSYHFFMTWITRDAVLLAQRCGMPIAPEVNARFARACSICRWFQLPDGMTPVISDGYPLDMSVFYPTLPQFEDNGIDSDRIFLPDSCMAIMSSNGTYALLDGSPLWEKFAHYHCGKQGLTLWFKGRSFIEEGGCCNYDEKLFVDFFKTARAHASLIVDGQGDGELEGRYCWNQAAECKMHGWVGNVICSTETSSVWGDLVWQRELQTDTLEALVTDRIQRSGGRGWQLIFPLAPEVKVTFTEGANSFLLENQGVKVLLRSDLAGRMVDSYNVRNFEIKSCRALEFAGKGDQTVRFAFKVQ